MLLMIFRETSKNICFTEKHQVARTFPRLTAYIDRQIRMSIEAAIHRCSKDTVLKIFEKSHWKRPASVSLFQ